MAITRLEPFREMTSLRREMDRLFDRLEPWGNGDSDVLTFIPSAEIEETNNEIHLKLEVPGLEAKDLEVQVAEDSVAISGERKSETKTEDRGVKRSEFHYGKFERVIPLPAQIKSDKAKAEYKNGILTLTLPKSEEHKKKIVKVKGARSIAVLSLMR